MIGVVTEGLFAGNHVEGVDRVLFRHDGVMVIDYRGVILFPDGLAVGITLKGFMHDATLTPPFEAMLDAELEFADVDMPVHGAGTRLLERQGLQLHGSPRCRQGRGARDLPFTR